LSRASRNVLIALIILVCIGTGLWGYASDSWREPDDTGDESAYLDQAAWIAEHGGPIGFLKLCYTGRFPHFAANPLLPATASAFAERDLHFVRPARLFKAVLTTLSLIALFLLTARLAGWERAAWLVLLLVLSRNWLNKSAVFTIDPIIYAMIFVDWLLIAGLWKPKGRWLWAGALFGLSLMAKGTSWLMLGGLIAAAILRLVFYKDRFTLLRSRGMWLNGALFLAGFLALSSPYTLNTVLRGEFLDRYVPFAALWRDRPGQDERVDEVSEGAADYFRTRGPVAAAKRLAWGMTRMAPRFAGVFACSKEAPKPIWLGTVFLSAAFVALALWRIARYAPPWVRWVTICFLGVGFLLHSWWAAVTYASRFAATFGPVLAWFAAEGIAVTLDRKRAVRAWAVHAAAVVALAALLVSNGRRLPASPAETIPLEPDYQRLMTWYDENVVTEERVCIHTFKLGWRFRFVWMLGDTRWSDLPPFEDYEAFMNFADESDAAYFIVIRDAVALREPLLGAYFADDPETGLRLKAPLPGWRRIFADEDGVTDYICYERKRGEP